MLWILFAAWVIGVVGCVMANAYFNWELEYGNSISPPCIIFIAPFWFIVLPFFLLGVVHDYFHILGEKHRLYKVEQSKLRIYQIKETAQLLEVDEKEAEEIWKTRNP